MVFLFAGCLTLGAFLIVVTGMSFGTVCLCAGVFFCIVFFSYPKKLIVYGAFVFSLAIVVGAFSIERLVSHDVIVGNHAFIATVRSITGGDEMRTIIAEDTEGARYKVTTSALVLPGDTVSIRGTVQIPEDFISKTTGRTVRYKHLMEARRVDATIAFAQVSVIESGSSYTPLRLLTKLQFFLTDLFSRFIAYPFDTIVSGMVLGVQNAIPEAIRNLFLATGTLHVLVLSGYNITLVAGMLGALFRNSRPQVRSLIMFLGIVFLVGVSGVGVAALRAAVMGSLTLLALLARRSYDPLRGLMIAYLFFFFLNPLEIFYDPSFHLSFLATFAIIVIYPMLEARFVRATSHWKREMQGIVIISLLMPLWMFPYSIYFSGVVAGSAPIANIVAAVLVPIITILGIILLCIAWCSPIAYLIGTLLTIGTSFFILILKFCARIPVWNAPPIAWWITVLVYIATTLFLTRKKIRLWIQAFRTVLLPPTN